MRPRRSAGQNQAKPAAEGPREDEIEAPDRSHKAIPPDQWDQIIQAAFLTKAGGERPQIILGMRDQSMVALGFGSGLRSIEIQRANIGHVDLVKLTVYVPRGKGNKKRTSAISQYAADLIEAYLDERPTAEKDEPLFISRKGGGRLTTRAIRYVFDRIETLLGLKFEEVRRSGQSDGSLHAHACRHSHITEVVKRSKLRDKTLFDVMRQAGHASADTTQRYFHADTDDLVAMAEDL